MSKQETNNFSVIKSELLTQLLDNRFEFFKFFLANNGIFQLISEEDYNRLILESQVLSITSTYYSILSLGAVFITDQFLFRYFAPNFRINSFRFPLFLGKYIGIPLLVSTMSYSYLIKQLERSYEEIDEKYNLGMTEFNLAMDVFERAFNVGKLEELIEEKENFNWKKVYEIEEYKKNSQNSNNTFN